MKHRRIIGRKIPEKTQAGVLQAIMHTSLHAAGPAGHFIDNTLQGTSGAINQIGRTASETVFKGTEAVSKGIGDAFGSLFGGGRRVAQPPPAAAAE